jgi:hypothetical protein
MPSTTFYDLHTIKNKYNIIFDEDQIKYKLQQYLYKNGIKLDELDNYILNFYDKMNNIAYENTTHCMIDVYCNIINDIFNSH